MLPNFLCIGSQKAGTTTISQVLESHPGVYMAQPRETRFFVDETRFAFGLQNYEMMFFSGWNGQPAVGEKTPEYLLFNDTAARVQATLGDDVRLIVSVRNPAKRAFSQFRHNLMQRVETLTFAQALDEELARIQRSPSHTALFGYHHRGCYARRLQPWLETFKREQILILKFETDVAGPAMAQLPARLFAFLGLPAIDRGAIPKLGRPDPTRWHVASDTLEAESGGAKTLVRRPSPFLLDFARRAQAALPASDTLTHDEAIELNNRLWRDDITELAELVDLDLCDWLG